MNMLSNILGHDEDHEKSGPRGIKSLGPQNLRRVTNGQIKRANARRVESRRRKAVKRHRRQWLATQRQISVLRGQLEVVANIRFDDTPLTALQQNAVAQLTARYGSVAKAAEHFDAVITEQERLRVEAAEERRKARA